MRIRAIAANTFAGLLRNKLIVFFFAGFVCIVLLMMTPLLMLKSMAASAPETLQSSTYPMIGAVMGMVSGFGSLLAAWAAADSVWGEMKSGTILAVMARPVRRWEFLLGKYLGVQLLMAVYIVLMFGLSYALAWLGGGRIQSAAPWALIASGHGDASRGGVWDRDDRLCPRLDPQPRLARVFSAAVGAERRVHRASLGRAALGVAVPHHHRSQAERDPLDRPRRHPGLRPGLRAGLFPVRRLGVPPPRPGARLSRRAASSQALI
ncbi:MAG: ABC transporter permease [Acidobacteriia bacterium]|nr:ABC transporter permease [Terriglobia bacterium]